jgi:hypothetical protein
MFFNINKQKGMQFRGYEIKKSTHQHKKYMAKVNNEWIHFGDNRYEQYYDKIGLYSDKNHNDESRKKSYHARHGVNHREGTAVWFSFHALW